LTRSQIEFHDSAVHASVHVNNARHQYSMGDVTNKAYALANDVAGG